MKLTLIAAAILVLGGTGCSTGRNLMPSEVHDVPPMKVYGGVRAAVRTFPSDQHGAGIGSEAVWPLAAVDVVASAVADTLTLPVTVVSSIYRHVNAEDYLAGEPVPLSLVPVEETIELQREGVVSPPAGSK